MDASGVTSGGGPRSAGARARRGARWRAPRAPGAAGRRARRRPAAARAPRRAPGRRRRGGRPWTACRSSSPASAPRRAPRRPMEAARGDDAGETRDRGGAARAEEAGKQVGDVRVEPLARGAVHREPRERVPTFFSSSPLFPGGRGAAARVLGAHSAPATVDRRADRVGDRLGQRAPRPPRLRLRRVEELEQLRARRKAVYEKEGAARTHAPGGSRPPPRHPAPGRPRRRRRRRGRPGCAS